ncbi:MAG: DAK2 domain-containing protein [Aeromicrobium sp.]
MSVTMNATAFAKWSQLCVDALGIARAEIDALNVFPVPDSDTGTNVYLTFVAGADALAALGDGADLPEMTRAYANGVLMGAKGNSGVILSQLIRACFREFNTSPTMDAADVARAFAVASDAAYAAVGEPVEGTILSVAKAAAEGAATAARAGKDARETFAAAAHAARVGLAHTPEQMKLLARAGVVDAGGRALVVVLDTTEHALTGRFLGDHISTARAIPVPIANDDLVAGGPSYEVMYLLDAEDEAIMPLRAALAGLGDSLVVVGGEGLWNVHVHVDDVGAALEAGIAAGRPYRIAVTHFADQITSNFAVAKGQRTGRVVIAATTGAGLTSLCVEAGARALMFDRAQQLNISRMKAELRDAQAAEIIVLPNNPRYVGLFEAAAKEAAADGIRIAVIPTQAQVEGLAALAVHDAGRSFEEDVVAMSSAAAHTQHGAITVATEPGMTMVGPCQPGDILGVVAGDFAYIGKEAADVAIEVLDRILSPGSEMVTLVVGHGADEGLAERLQAHVQANRPDIDAVVYEGGQENYPLFIAVE